MKSSATSTDASSAFRPWHLFVMGALVAATVGVVLSPGAGPAHLILLSLAVGGAALAGLALHRTLWPLAARELTDQVETVGGRTRAALEREKMLVLRSIKELEFDRAMGKVSEQDFHDMGARLRARAMGLMKQLDGDTSEYRELIEREVRARVQATVASRQLSVAGQALQSTVAAGSHQSALGPQPSVHGPETDRAVCASCGTGNDHDARFCKSCGARLTGL